MFGKPFLILLSVAEVFAISHVGGASVSRHRHEATLHRSLSYRDYWPKKIPLVIAGPDGRRSVVQINGRAYWASLPAAKRARILNFGTLQGYCQDHEGR